MRDTERLRMQERSVVLQPRRELAAPSIARSPKLEKIVGGSLALAREAALESNDPDALVQQALRIQDGRPVMAFCLFERAALAGHAQAQFHLSHCYYAGNGVKKDRAKSLDWLYQSAELGFSRAQNELACFALCVHASQTLASEVAAATCRQSILTNPLGEAVKWFRKSAAQGDSYGEWSLGCCYTDGKGVQQDDAKAMTSFRKAAKQGLAWAQNELGFCYLVGRGVRKNIFQALRWYRRAAEGGNAGGQYGLGRCYQLGLGVLQDSLQAFKWLRLAADQDHERAKEEITALATQMSSVQLRAARALYEEFKMNKAFSDGGDVGMK